MGVFKNVEGEEREGRGETGERMISPASNPISQIEIDYYTRVVYSRCSVYYKFIFLGGGGVTFFLTSCNLLN